MYIIPLYGLQREPVCVKMTISIMSSEYNVVHVFTNEYKVKKIFSIGWQLWVEERSVSLRWAHSLDKNFHFSRTAQGCSRSLNRGLYHHTKHDVYISQSGMCKGNNSWKAITKKIVEELGEKMEIIACRKGVCGRQRIDEDFSLWRPPPWKQYPKRSTNTEKN